MKTKFVEKIAKRYLVNLVELLKGLPSGAGYAARR